MSAEEHRDTLGMPDVLDEYPVPGPRSMDGVLGFSVTELGVSQDVEAGKDVLLVVEEALRHVGLAAVVGEIDGPVSLTASRRLQLAAETSGGLGLMLRRPRRLGNGIGDTGCSLRASFATASRQ